jgi:glycosyltransferase involved in cell wall biosynthesis
LRIGQAGNSRSCEPTPTIIAGDSDAPKLLPETGEPRGEDRRVTVLGLEHAGRFSPPAECLGGSERVALLALEQLASRGFRVLLACPPNTELAREARRRGVATRPFRFLTMHRTRDVRTALSYLRSVATVGRDLGRLCREEQVDVVHSFSMIAGLYAVVAATHARVPLIVHVQDAQDPRRLVRHAALRVIGHRATRLICVSRAVERMLRESRLPAGKLVLLYNAVEPRFFEPNHEPLSAVTGRGPHIGLFSHIIPWKGQDVFLEAAALVAERFPSARFYVVGATAVGVPESYVASLHGQADGPPLAGRVRLTGPCRDVAPLMAAMDVVVHTSVRPEAFGLVIAEGMALGKSVVVADCGAPPELVTHRKTGYIARAGDAQDLARVLEQVLERRDPEIERRAAAVARDRFAPELFGDELESLYDDVLRPAVRVGE